VSQLAPHHAVRIQFAVLGTSVAAWDSTPPGAIGTALLVPGYTGSKEDFAPLFDPLTEAGYRVVAIDQPGQYESPGPETPLGYNVAWLGEVVSAVTTALDAGPVHLLGHSFGGLVARASVLADPTLFRSLTLLCSGPAAIAGARRDRMAKLEPLLPLGMAAVYQEVERGARLDPRWLESPAELKAFLKERFVTSSAAGLRGMGDALGSEPDLTEDLAATRVPILVCHGENDDAWLPPVQAEMARRLEASHVVIPQAAHSPAIENTRPTVTALIRFWDAHRAPDGSPAHTGEMDPGR
jgi:pimeloyl-ACP methyl ester carboxylesterase